MPHWRRTRRNSPSGRLTLKPGIASSLSSVPPVWPRPRPLIIGTVRPPAATMGARIREVLSPMPPVECLSTFFAEDFGMVEDFSGVQHHFGERRELGAVHAADPHRHQPRGHLVIRNVAARIAGNEKINFFAGKFPGITFLADQVDGAHAFGKANGERNIRYRGRQRDARSSYSTCCTSGGRLVVWPETTSQPLGVLT